MSKWSRDSDDLDRRIQAALIVGEFGPDGVSPTDHLGHTSERDPFEVER
jgi:hypothetical protein